MYSIPMAIADFVPVVFFASAAYILLKDLYNMMSKGAYAFLCAGLFNVILAGSCKALHKLLYAAGICDFKALSGIFFPVQAFGFLMIGIALICLVTMRQGKGRMYAAAPALFSGTMVFVGLMISGLAGMDIGLSVIACRMKLKKTIGWFALNFVFCLMMGYLSSRDFSAGWMNWMAEAVNSIGQLALLAGVRILDRKGLEHFQMEKE